MAGVTVKSDDNVELQIERANQQIKAYLNGREIYSKVETAETLREPLGDRVPINGLRGGHNVLVVLGASWGGAGQYTGKITVNGKAITQWDEVTSAYGITFDAGVELFQRD